MISVIFLVLFTQTNSIQFVTSQETFKTMEECNLYAEGEKFKRQQEVLEGISAPHIARHMCVNWGKEL